MQRTGQMNITEKPRCDECGRELVKKRVPRAPFFVGSAAGNRDERFECPGGCLEKGEQRAAPKGSRTPPSATSRGPAHREPQ